ncbi:hypothetical protein NQ315_002819 [Exocentrus adspersus]|uniref:Uncharacterized protein n=1 Tax=Exocentrus adspersus TaxID=1586481 RepID=A0AAV8VE91_9CUCU|nr:hypothetical protein NQ315_002819 [Exocentrus adspersus]
MAEQNFVLDLNQRIVKTNDGEIILNFPKIRALPTWTVKTLKDIEIREQIYNSVIYVYNGRDAYRSEVHKLTGRTPASVVFGTELRLPIDLITDRSRKEEHANDYFSHLKNRLRLTHEDVRQKLKLESDRMMTSYDLRANTCGFEVGEKVWLYNPNRAKEKSPKLQKSESELG